MPNDFGALVDSTLVHDVTDDLTDDLEPILGLALNLGEEQSDLGIVRTGRPGQAITIKDWSATIDPYLVGAGGYIAPDYNAKNDVVVTLPDAVWAASMALTAAEYRVLIGGPRQNVAYDQLREKTGRMMTFGLRKKMATSFFAEITAGNYPDNTVSAVGTFNRAKEVLVEKELFDRKLMSRANATLILNSTAFSEWQTDHIAVHTNTGALQGDRLLDGGHQSSVTPFKVWRTGLAMPAAADRGIAFTKTAAVMVQRIPDEPTTGDHDPVSLKTVIDTGTDEKPGSGLSFLHRLWKNPGTGQIQWDVATIFKFQKLQGEAIERVTAA